MADLKQIEISLPRRTRADYLQEQLAAAVEAANATTDSAERVRIHHEITRLRALLGVGGAA